MLGEFRGASRRASSPPRSKRARVEVLTQPPRLLSGRAGRRACHIVPGCPGATMHGQLCASACWTRRPLTSRSPARARERSASAAAMTLWRHHLRGDARSCRSPGQTPSSARWLSAQHAEDGQLGRQRQRRKLLLLMSTPPPVAADRAVHERGEQSLSDALKFTGERAGPRWIGGVLLRHAEQPSAAIDSALSVAVPACAERPGRTTEWHRQYLRMASGQRALAWADER